MVSAPDYRLEKLACELLDVCVGVQAARRIAEPIGHFRGWGTVQLSQQRSVE